MPALPVPRESTLCRIRSTKAAAQNRWIAYNRMRGQHSSAMEHATPEQFWIDRNQCRYVEENGQIKNATLPDCGQAVSAVKALAIAQQQGQKIYTITPQNASAALAKLPISGSVGQEIRNAVQAGKEVTIHEKPINAHEWSGYGYSIIDPDTGVGGYIIEGSGNGAVIAVFGSALAGVIGLYLLPLVTGTALLAVALMISIAIHVAVIALSVLIATGELNPHDIFIGSVAALSLLRALGTLLPALGVTFAMPGGIVMGIILVSLAIIGFSKIGEI